MNIDSPVPTRDPWLPLPPKGGKDGTNETALTLIPCPTAKSEPK